MQKSFWWQNWSVGNRLPHTPSSNCWPTPPHISAKFACTTASSRDGDTAQLVVCQAGMLVVAAFSLLAWILGGRFNNSFPTCAFYFFFFKVEISLHPPIPLFRPGSVHSGSASWDDCGQVFPDELRVNLFSLVINSPTMPGQHSQPTPTLLGQGCMCFQV